MLNLINFQFGSKTFNDNETGLIEESSEMNNTQYSIASLLILTLSLLVDIPCLLIIIACRKRLVKIEFYILLVKSLFIGEIRMINIIICIKYIYGFDKNNNPFFCSITYILNLQSLFAYYAVLFYYSLFHFSAIQRTKFVDLIRSVRNFFIYTIVVVSLFLTFILTYSYTFRFALFARNSTTCSIEYSKFAITMPLVLLSVSFLPVFVYSIATIMLLFKRSKTECKLRQRKTLKLSIKFLLFSSFTCLMSLSQNLTTILVVLFFKNDIFFICSVFEIVFYLLFFIHPIFVNVIHKILRNRLKEVISSGLSNVFN